MAEETATKPEAVPAVAEAKPVETAAKPVVATPTQPPPPTPTQPEPVPMAESQGARWLSENWEMATWGILTLFYITCVGFFVKSLHAQSGRDSLWFYFVVITSCFGFATLNVILFRSIIRSVLAMTVLGFGAYAVPFSIYAFGCSMETAAASGVCYVIAMVAISPRFVGLTILICGICFAVVQKKYYVGIGENVMGDVTKITAAYVGMAALAYCWRLLLQKLYDLLIIAYVKKDFAQDEIEERDAQIADLSKDNSLLRDEIVSHISEIDKIIDNKR